MAQLVYQGHVIGDKGEMLSLTDMWNAAGADPSKQPAKWRDLPSTKEFSGYLADVILQKSEDEIFRVTRGGKAPGTWAHWQAAMNYARYLEPAFAAWCNQVVRERMEGKALSTASALTDYDKQIIGNIVKNCTGVMVREALAPVQTDLVEARKEIAELRDKIESPATCSAIELWAEEKFPAVKGGTVWLGNRLIEMGCLPEFGSRSKLGGRWRRLFDAGRARAAMKNGLKLYTERYISERLGQGKFKL